MRIKKIDILSESPAVYIFNEDDNKTVFGGVLSLIFLIILFLVSFFYLTEYFGGDKYKVEYGIQQNYLTEKENEAFLNNSKYNPVLTFSLDFQTDNLTDLSERFVLFDIAKGVLIDKYEKITHKVSELQIIALYKCEDKECSLNQKDISQLGYPCNFKYQGFELDHQGDVPLHKSNNLYTLPTRFFFNKPLLQYFKWEIIKYGEESFFETILNNIFDKEDEDLIGGHFTETNVYFVDGILDENGLYRNIEGNKYKTLGFFNTIPDYNKIEMYKRTRVSILDAIADICSLSSMILEIFSFIFRHFYEKNFDNYKIIENILSKEKNLNNNLKNKKEEGKEDIIIKKDGNIDLIPNSKKERDIIENIQTEYNLETKNEQNMEHSLYELKGNINDKIKREKKNERVIPRLSFCEFIRNNFYSKCCKRMNRQDIICSCNGIVSKYYTIEDIIYNQMRLENLFKDYKWNNPELNNINNNESIIKLKSYYEK